MKQAVLSCKVLLLCAFLSLMVFASIPKAQAANLERYPTATTEIVAGWVDPENAYSKDDNYAYVVDTDGAEQEYSDFGFNFNSSVTLDKVSLYINVASANLEVDYPDDFCWVQYVVKIYNGSWITLILKEPAVSLIGDNVGDVATANFMVATENPEMDITPYFSTAASINNFKMRVLFDIQDAGIYQDWWIDVIGLEVAYTTIIEKVNTAKWFLLGSMLSMPIMLAIALNQRKQRKP